LIHAIASLPKGYDFAVEALSMWIQKHKKSQPSIDQQIALCGRELLNKFVFERSDRGGGYRLGEIIDYCFLGDDAVQNTIDFCQNIKTAVREYRLYPNTNWHLFESLFRAQPYIALDQFVGEEPVNTRLKIKEIDGHGRNPLNVVPIDVLIAWAQVDPSIRFAKLAAAINPVKKDSTRGFIFTETALKILGKSPERLTVLTIFGENLKSYRWRSSMSDTANTIEKLRSLPQAFFEVSDPSIVAWARECDADLARLAEKERVSERRTDESFE
jgi:hypothetical protein